MVDPEALAKLLGLLHANGYRLRKLGPDTIELDDQPRTGPPPSLTSDQDMDELERKERDEDTWAHVGGRPPFLRRPEEQPRGSEWADEERPKS